MKLSKVDKKIYKNLKRDKRFRINGAAAAAFAHATAAATAAAATFATFAAHLRLSPPSAGGLF
jgi:hypothetical protein